MNDIYVWSIHIFAPNYRDDLVIVDDFPVYVGKDAKGFPTRVNEHFDGNGGAPLLWEGIQELGREAFTFVVLERNVPPEILGEREDYWINELGTAYPNGFNVAPGGQGGDIYSNLPPDKQAKRNKKISVGLKGKKRQPFTDEHRNNMSNARKGKPSPNKGNKGKKYRTTRSKVKRGAPPIQETTW